MKILSVSDYEHNLIYSPQILKRFNDVNLVIGCGDLPYYYLEFIISMLNVPLYFVRGNHDSLLEHGVGGDRTAPLGGIDLHKRCVRDEPGLLLAGIEGSIRYNNGPFQYTQQEMWRMVLGMAPKLFFNKLRYGRFLDLFITHSPPWEIHDKKDRAHQGFKSFRWLIEVFKPRYHLHGHVHIYRSNEITDTIVKQTRIINSFGYRELVIDLDYRTA